MNAIDCRSGRGWAGFSPAVHHLPIYHRNSIAPPPSKTSVGASVHCTGASHQLVSACSHLTRLRLHDITSRCVAITRRPSSMPPTKPTRASWLPSATPSVSWPHLHRHGVEPRPPPRHWAPPSIASSRPHHRSLPRHF